MTPPTPPDPQDASAARGIEEIDLRRLLHVLLRYRTTIIVCTLVVTAAAVAASLASTRYLAQGLFLTPEVTLDAYKRYDAALNNRARLQAFLADGGLEGTHVADMLQDLVERPEEMQEAVRPVFDITERDAKVFAIRPGEEGAVLMGVQLALERNRDEKSPPVLMLAEFVRSTMILVDLQDAMLQQCLLNTARALELRNEQIDAEFNITQQETLAESLRAIIRENPRAETIDNRQVVSVEQGAERFLSPMAQLVAVEVSISNIRAQGAKRERDRVAAQLKKDYYCAAHESSMASGTGQKLLASLHAIQDKAFANADPAQDVVEFTANELLLERSKWVSKYLQRSRFVASPEGAERVVRTPRLSFAVLLGLALGSLLGALIALSRAWWRRNRSAVMADDGDL